MIFFYGIFIYNFKKMLAKRPFLCYYSGVNSRVPPSLGSSHLNNNHKRWIQFRTRRLIVDPIDKDLRSYRDWGVWVGTPTQTPPPFHPTA